MPKTLRAISKNSRIVSTPHGSSIKDVEIETKRPIFPFRTQQYKVKRVQNSQSNAKVK
jgi:hypothetical protein